MHNIIFINSNNSQNKHMSMNYSVPNKLYSIKTKREVEDINRLVNNYIVSYKKNKNNFETSKVEKNYKNELDLITSILDKTRIEKKIINDKYEILKERLKKIEEAERNQIVNNTEVSNTEVSNTEVKKSLGFSNKLTHESLNSLLDECVDEKMIEEISNKMIEKIFKINNN